MPGLRTVVAGALLGAAAFGALAACSTASHGPTYTDAELQAKCEREGGWWRGYLIPGYCESQAATMP